MVASGLARLRAFTPYACDAVALLSTATAVRLCERLHQLDPVAEGVVDVDAVVSLERFVVDHPVAGGSDHHRERTNVFDEKGGMGLGRRSEAGVDTEVDLEVAPLEPASSAGRRGSPASGRGECRAVPRRTRSRPLPVPPAWRAAHARCESPSRQAGAGSSHAGTASRCDAPDSGSKLSTELGTRRLTLMPPIALAACQLPPAWP